MTGLFQKTWQNLSFFTSLWYNYNKKTWQQGAIWQAQYPNTICWRRTTGGIVSAMREKQSPAEPSAARHWTFRMYCGKLGTGKPASSGNRSGDWWEQADRRIASSCQWQRFHMIQLTNDSLRFYRADAAYYSGDCQDGGVGRIKAQHFFCRTAIRYIQHLPAARLLKSAVVPFELEALGE